MVLGGFNPPSDRAAPHLAGHWLLTTLNGGLILAGQGLLGARPDDPDDPPPLQLGQRPGLHDLDQVPDMRGIGLVVRVADGPATQHLAVLGMRHQALDDDPPRLDHLVGGHDPDLRLATAPGRQRLATGWAGLAHRVLSRDVAWDSSGRVDARDSRPSLGTGPQPWRGDVRRRPGRITE